MAASVLGENGNLRFFDPKNHSFSCKSRTVSPSGVGKGAFDACDCGGENDELG